LVFFFAIVAPAEMKIFPMWERMEYGSEPAPQFACYDFTTAQTIVKLDLDLQLQLKEFEGLKLKYADVDLAYQKLSEANTLVGRAIDRLEERNAEKQKVLEDTTVALKKAEARSVWNYLPWIITGTVVLATAGFGIGFYVGSR